MTESTLTAEPISSWFSAQLLPPLILNYWCNCIWLPEHNESDTENIFDGTKSSKVSEPTTSQFSLSPTISYATFCWKMSSGLRKERNFWPGHITVECLVVWNQFLCCCQQQMIITVTVLLWFNFLRREKRCDFDNKRMRVGWPYIWCTHVCNQVGVLINWGAHKRKEIMNYVIMWTHAWQDGWWCSTWGNPHHLSFCQRINKKEEEEEVNNRGG